MLVRGFPWDFPSPLHVALTQVVLTLFKASLFKLQELQQHLQSSEREKEMYRQQVTSKEAELTRAIQREQQQIQEMRQQVSLVPVALHGV